MRSFRTRRISCFLSCIFSFPPPPPPPLSLSLSHVQGGGFGGWFHGKGCECDSVVFMFSLLLQAIRVYEYGVFAQ